jgi:hypothetical protein
LIKINSTQLFFFKNVLTGNAKKKGSVLQVTMGYLGVRNKRPVNETSGFHYPILLGKARF